MPEQMTIGITGSSGNIGTTLINGLREEYDLKLFDQKNSSFSKDIDFQKVNLAEKDNVTGKFQGIDIIIHVAGDPRPDAPVESTIKNNFIATSNVYNEAYKSGVKKIIFASSNFYHQGSIMEILSKRRNSLIKLDDFPSPECMYAKSKVYGEDIGYHYSLMGMKFVALRIGWTVPQDNPKYYWGDYMRSMFLSHRDLIQLVKKSIEIKNDFVVAFGISNNDKKIFDLTETREIFGYEPLDNAEKY